MAGVIIKEAGKAAMETMLEEYAYIPAVGATAVAVGAAVGTYARDPKNEYNPEDDKTKN